tara:strand:+ start:167 stop:1939 length:1773 start_codon:yes stop_codon:yes gene_type:complete
MSVLKKLTEGIVRRDLSREGEALLNKWKRTGLLEGIRDDRGQHGMAILLENQAKELLRETSTMSAGNVEGFASVAFPIVRRVFGGLIANDLVSVQPMSLPSGLIFFLDFTVSTPTGLARLGYPDGSSLYGGGVIGSQITGGVSLTGVNAERSFYALNNGYSSPTGSGTIAVVVVATGTVGSPGTWGAIAGAPLLPNGLGYNTLQDRNVRFDPDLSGSNVAVGRVLLADFTADTPVMGDPPDGQLNVKDYITITTSDFTQGMQVRRLTRDDTDGQLAAPAPVTHLYYILAATGSETLAELSGALDGNHATTWAVYDNFDGGSALGSVIGAPAWGLEDEVNIPEINIQVDSVAVTAITKKLKAKWTPELAQDLNAYHNLDAEVELTSILSEQIALEIDQEILEDLVKGATAGTQFWSRLPGKFVDSTTGTVITGATFPDFTGNVSEWYETLAETINDVSAQIHRKTLRGGANFVVTSPEVANILEFTAGFRGQVTHDDDRGSIGTVKVGNLSKKWDVYVDPYFPRNLVLVGRKGSSFLESGYVYSPYVPLQMTPTIFGPEDFVPRKGVMTRYAKKMVRPDMYGLVVVEDLLS